MDRNAAEESRFKDIQVLLIDDNELFRTGVARILATEADLSVVAEMPAEDGAITVAEAERPDIVLVDVEMRAARGESYLRRLRQASPLSKIIVLTMNDDPALVRRLLAAGVRAYILKTATRDEVLAALRAIARGAERTILSVSQETFKRLEAQEGPDHQGSTRRGTRLSAREHEVLTWLALGMRNAQIARTLGITEGTVKRHLTNIYTKLGATSRMGAVTRALSQDLISLGSPAPTDHDGPDRTHPPRTL